MDAKSFVEQLGFLADSLGFSRSSTNLAQTSNVPQKRKRRRVRRFFKRPNTAIIAAAAARKIAKRNSSGNTTP